MKGNSMNQDNKAEWYVVHTYSGYENKVKVDIEKTVENRDLGDEILEVIVPTEQVTEHKEDGTKKTMSRKMFPGYVLVKMIQGIDLPEDKPRERIEFKGQVGDSVIILSGPFAEMQGKIKNINDSRQELTIVVDMFGRETPAEVNFGDVRII